MRRSLIVGVMVGLGLLAVLDALAARAALVAGAVPRAAGPWPWLASRAAGVTAYGALALDVTFGLFLSTGAADRWIARARSVDVHRWLSSVTLLLVATHVLLLLGDGFVRFDVLDVVVPLLATYRPVPVALGVLAAYLAVVVHASFALRRRLGARTWQRVHRLTFAVFLLATAHGVLAGTDAGVPWMRGIYLSAGAVTGGLLLHRVRIRRRSLRAAPALPH